METRPDENGVVSDKVLLVPQAKGAGDYILD
jgi:hypothetical protein